MNNLVVFTGGPGSGKTSVIDCLKELGYACTDEVGRQVIKQQVEIGANALPWGDIVAYRNEMIREEVVNYHRHKNSLQHVFFDRSVIDSYGYSKLEGIPISDYLIDQCLQLEYHKEVFIFPPWQAIYTNDAERKQNFSTAISTYQEMVRAYKKFGYLLVEVPKVSVEERVEFILSAVKNI